MQKNLRSSVVKLCVAAALTFTVLCFSLYAQGNPEWVTYSYKSFSRGFMRFLGAVWSVFPFSAAEFLIYGGVVAIICYLVRIVMKTVKSDVKYLPPVRCFANLAVVAAALYAVFMLGWGLNYNALPLADELGLAVGAYNDEVLAAVGMEIVDELNALCDDVTRDADGVCDFGTFSGMTAAVQSGYAALYDGGDNMLFSGYVPRRAKPVAASRAMSYTNITGIFMPFTGEPNVNADIPDSSIPFTVAHEMAHSLGVAPEKEANFAAYLVCRESDSAEVRYSGYLAAFTYVYNAAPFDVMDEMWSALDEQVLLDFAHRREYWAGLAKSEIAQAIKQTATAVATTVNDSFIQAMGVPEGVKSYGMVVDLILADYAQRNGV